MPDELDSHGYTRDNKCGACGAPLGAVHASGCQIGLVQAEAAAKSRQVVSGSGVEDVANWRLRELDPHKWTYEATDRHAEDVRALDNAMREHEKLLRRMGPGNSLVERFNQIVTIYRDGSVRTIEAQQQFRDDLLVQLRAFSLVVDMTGSASTHAEKAARLRGLSELLEGSISRLREMRFDDHEVWRFQWPDAFKSDYPSRVFLDRIHELEAKVKELEAQPPIPQRQQTDPASFSCGCGASAGDRHYPGCSWRHD